MTPQETTHFRILRLIEDNPHISQRELARELGVSVGKSHYLVRALLEKGLVKMNNFRRSDNKLAYAYLLTPSGIAAKLSLTKAFLRHKETEYESLRGEITQLRQELEATGQGEVP
jgi:EPS-associated MarR family transcriptional regulator